MSDESLPEIELPEVKVNIRDWILAAPNPQARQLRQAVDITLNAFASFSDYVSTCSLKGGILMGLAYGSPRLTADIDLSLARRPNKDDPEEIKGLLNASFDFIAFERGHPDMALRVGVIKRLPKGKFDESDFPGLGVKVLYAHRNNEGQMRRLEAGMGGPTLSLDISFNEPAEELQLLSLSEESSILAYGRAELIAEKLRALLQQIPRKRERRQDPYDIWHLVENTKITDEDKVIILKRLIAKSESRGIFPSLDSLQNPEISRRASARWSSLELELGKGKLPEFKICWKATVDLYESLPWAEM